METAPRDRRSEHSPEAAVATDEPEGAWALDMGSENMWVLPSDLTAAGLARGYVVAACLDVPADKLDVARLLVTELVTNAVLHGSGIVLLVVARDGAGLRVDVYDENPHPPVVVDPWPLMENGAGMRLVAALADSWGVAPRDGLPGKRVWFGLV